MVRDSHIVCWSLGINWIGHCRFILTVKCSPGARRLVAVQGDSAGGEALYGFEWETTFLFALRFRALAIDGHDILLATISASKQPKSRPQRRNTATPKTDVDLGDAIGSQREMDCKIK